VALDCNHVDAERHAHGSNARRRSWLGLIRYQAGLKVDFITKKLECRTPETFQHFCIGPFRIRNG
jgi:hypothetical protein